MPSRLFFFGVTFAGASPFSFTSGAHALYFIVGTITFISSIGKLLVQTSLIRSWDIFPASLLRPLTSLPFISLFFGLFLLAKTLLQNADTVHNAATTVSWSFSVLYSSSFQKHQCSHLPHSLPRKVYFSCHSLNILLFRVLLYMFPGYLL